MGADGEGEPGRGMSYSDTLSLCEWFTVSILALSVSLRSTALPKGEPRLPRPLAAACGGPAKGSPLGRAGIAKQ